MSARQMARDIPPLELAQMVESEAAESAGLQCDVSRLQGWLQYIEDGVLHRGADRVWVAEQIQACNRGDAPPRLAHVGRRG